MVTATNAKNEQTTYSYTNGYLMSQSYDALGRVTVVKNPLGVFSNVYNGVTSRLTNITTTNNGQALFQMSYTYYDNTGDRGLKTITNTSSQEGFLSSFLYSSAVPSKLTRTKLAGFARKTRTKICSLGPKCRAKI